MKCHKSDWAFADCSSTPFPGKPDLTKLCVKGGFDPALAYTLAFTAKNPEGAGHRLCRHPRSGGVPAL